MYGLFLNSPDFSFFLFIHTTVCTLTALSSRGLDFGSSYVTIMILPFIRKASCLNPNLVKGKDKPPALILGDT